jgi:hypothetical protein
VVIPVLSAILVGVVIGASVTIMTANESLSGFTGASAGGTSSGPLLATPGESPHNATDCNLLNVSGLAGEGLGDIEANVSAMFARLCVLPAFEALLFQWGGWVYVPPVTANGTTIPGHWGGPTNFTVQYGGSDSNPTVYVAFVVFWVATCTVNQSGLPNDHWCSWNEYWSGNTSNNNLTGPLFYVGPVIIAGGPGLSRPSSFTGYDLALVGGVAVVLVVVASLVVVTRRGRNATRGAMSSLPATSVVSPPTILAPIEVPVSVLTKGPSVAPTTEPTTTNADPLNDVF